MMNIKINRPNINKGSIQEERQTLRMGAKKIYSVGKKTVNFIEDTINKGKDIYSATLGQEGQDRRFIKRAERFEKMNEKREQQIKKYGFKR